MPDATRTSWSSTITRRSPRPFAVLNAQQDAEPQAAYLQALLGFPHVLRRCECAITQLTRKCIKGTGKEAAAMVEKGYRPGLVAMVSQYYSAAPHVLRLEIPRWGFGGDM